MTIVIGIDPGLHGALCLMSNTHGILEIEDVPTTMRLQKNGKEIRRPDKYALANIIDRWSVAVIARAAIELVAPRGRRMNKAGQWEAGDTPAVAGSLMFTAGVLQMAVAAHFIPVEEVSTADWRKGVGIPAKTTKGDKAPVVARADSIWPDHQHLWRGARGGVRADRAESALIAKYCLDHGGAE